MDIRVQSAPFDTGTVLSEFTDRQDGAGAIVSFSGLVRDNDGALTAMEIEHYPAMTQKALTAIAAEARERFDLADVLILHRYGRLTPQEPIMMVATAALHRKAAFEAADFLMDFLKSRAPFWKKEHGAQNATWVDAKTEDEDALLNWKQ